ncbi:cytochrome b/b6 domain-containing protein [Marinobacterium sp. D7]|uniref:cytochrome b/b6 domain-containing protein n=1 Tax=Marinobacterium ramblicola TaxID=2849041 RepID=UPI001C2CF4D1|nr:cytochrome b/b6 domain-containing protein [Marinobacterium ramblicola]MBV1789092.1 cytochrome b/b6 domain-containing protein [Marinobacterium ramblicola]
METLTHTANTVRNQASARTIKVWDPLVRIFHWSLVGFFAIAWATAEEIQFLHEWSGYAIAALVGFRLVWGVIGTRYARFSDFIYRPSRVKAYLKELFSGRARHYVGHNPAGGLMVVGLLLGLAMLTFSGMALVAIDGEGPLAATWVAGLSEHLVKDIHEFFANLLLLLAGVHLAGVLVSSLLHRENLVRAMITGRKQVRDADKGGER